MRGKNTKRLQQAFLTFFIIMIMTTSILGFLWGRDSEEQLKYNDKSFTRQQSLWVAKIDGRQKSFYYFPLQVEDIHVDGGAIPAIKNAPMLYMTYELNQSGAEYIAQAIFDLDEELSSGNIYTVKALTGENKFGLPVVSCNNATPNVPVLYFKQENQTGISLNNNCIIAAAKTPADFLRVRDRLVYGFFGIIE